MNTETENLDSWIAEHVMGWDLESESFAFFKSHDCIYFPEKGKCAQVFKPTEDYESALHVLAKCAEKDSITIISTDKAEAKFVVTTGRTRKRSCEESLPLAVCRIAKALYSK